jgi:hypothetical protein
MACDTVNVTEESITQMQKDMDNLKEGLRKGTIKIIIDRRTGAIAFQGWNASGFIGDTCAARKLMSMNSAEYRSALAKAEALAGRKSNPAAIASGHHSHDGGATWHPGHTPKG